MKARFVFITSYSLATLQPALCSLITSAFPDDKLLPDKKTEEMPLTEQNICEGFLVRPCIYHRKYVPGRKANMLSLDKPRRPTFHK